MSLFCDEIPTFPKLVGELRVVWLLILGAGKDYFKNLMKPWIFFLEKYRYSKTTFYNAFLGLVKLQKPIHEAGIQN